MVSNGLCHEIKKFLLFTQNFKNTTLLLKSDDCRDVSVSLKFGFPSTLKRKAGVFEITYFEERFWRTIGYPRDKKKLAPQNPASSSSSSSLGTLSNGDGDGDGDGDGSENVAKKRNLHSCKLNRVYLDPLNMSNAGDVSWN